MLYETELILLSKEQIYCFLCVCSYAYTIVLIN